MSVISGDGAEELHLVQLSPGSAAQNALVESGLNGPEHSVQAGISEDDDFIVVNADHI